MRLEQNPPSIGISNIGENSYVRKSAWKRTSVKKHQVVYISVVRVQSRGYWYCNFLLFYTTDTAPTVVKKL